MRNSQVSAKRGATSCRPIGMPAAVKPQFIERGLFAHIPRHGEDDVLEWSLRVVQRRGPVGGEGLDLVGRRQQQVDLAEQPGGAPAHLEGLVETAHRIDPLTRAPPSAQAWT